MHLENISLFASPNAPDLGCLVRRKHGVEVEPTRNIHTDLHPSIDFAASHHQCYFRVLCGEAGFFQRALVHMTVDLSLPGPILETFPPDFILGGEHRPRPSDWQRFPTQSGSRVYWFFGQHRNPNGGSWTADKQVGHSYDIHENGTLSTVHYDDTGGDGDLDDLILEVAIVGRRSWRDIVQAIDQAAASEEAAEAVLAHARRRMAEAQGPDVAA